MNIENQLYFSVFIMIKLSYTAQLRTLRRPFTMNGSVKKDKKTDKYFYIVVIGIGHLTGKRKI